MIQHADAAKSSPRRPTTLTHPIGVVDGARPVRSLLRLLGRRPGHIAIAVGAFALKDIPLWFLPVVTSKIIDIVADRGPATSVLIWFGIGVVLLLQNYPNHLAYTRNFMVVVRDTGADLRNALAARLQSLSIGFLLAPAPPWCRRRWSATWRTSRSCCSRSPIPCCRPGWC